MTVCPQCQNELDADTGACFYCGRTENIAARPDPFIGHVVGNLVLVYKLGEGAMGFVFRASHKTLKTPYAVKILRQEYSHDDTVVERFRREAMACGRLQHENVVYVTDFGQHPALGLYLVMEFVDGPSLAQLLRDTPRLPLWRVARILSQVCEGMSAAHREGVVHRDLKPDNILVYRDPARRDFVKVVDFGLARVKLEGSSAELTAVGTTLGTVAYIAPEQLFNRADSVGPWSDVYALGVIAYEMVVGERPFKATSYLELAVKHATVVPPLVSAARPELAGTQLEALVARMLGKRPEDRPESMEVVRDALFDALSELVAMGLSDAAPPGGRGVRNSVSGPVVSLDPGRSGSFAASASGSFAAVTSPSQPPPPPGPRSQRVREAVQRFRREASDSAVASMIDALPGADAMPDDALIMALWGGLQHELLDAPEDSARLAQSYALLVSLVGATLEGSAASEPTASQQRVFQSLRSLVSLTEGDRRARLVEALRPCAAHPLFPRDLVPVEDRRSLAEKLNQPLSVESLRAVLTHPLGGPWRKK